jgi:beta-glucosidase
MARDVTALVAQLTVEEKAALLAGADLWSTVAVDRVGIPKVQVTDGPNGARGAGLPGDANAVSSFCAPCGSALGATWNPELAEAVGAVIGAEARTKECRVLLGPTVNIHRSPLAGRNFECYSEDPLLAGRIAAAWICGAQSEGVATTVKHYAGNDAEFERNSINSVIDERTLREITLVPFELAVRDGGSLGVMTAYNRLNGTFCSEHEWLLADVLRGEWGFEGFVVSDWFARGSTAGSIRAGLDLEMPGPGRVYGDALASAVRDGEVDEGLVDAAVHRLLSVFDRLGALDETPGVARAVDLPEHRTLGRRAAAESMVLLRNQGGVLPFDATAVRSIAVVGPNAEHARIMGGGSASLTPHRRIAPLDALRELLGDDVEIVHEPGCDIDRSVPPVEAEFTLEIFAAPGCGGAVVHTETRVDGRLLFFGAVPEGGASFRATATIAPSEGGPHLLTLVQTGPARVLLDGKVLLDGVTDPPARGRELFGMGSEELQATVDLVAGGEHTLVVEYVEPPSGFLSGVQVGSKALAPPDLLGRAVAAAARADAVIVVVGTNDDWESEGHDRESMDLPGDQPELIRRVAAANPRTAVVVNAGAPVTTDWAGDVPAVLAVWFGGQEMAPALVDVLFGATDPAGRLPTTFPARVEHNPSWGNFPGEAGQVRYGEGVLVGYRWYDARHLAPSFAFGHGLSYTTFAIGEPRLSASTIAADGTVVVEVEVTNTGARRGAEVVQCYVAPRAPSVTRPPKELKAFAKVWLDPGDTTTVALELGARAFAHWQPEADQPPADPTTSAIPMFAAPTVVPSGWRVDPGTYDLHVGRASDDLAHVAEVTITAS